MRDRPFDQLLIDATLHELAHFALEAFLEHVRFLGLDALRFDHNEGLQDRFVHVVEHITCEPCLEQRLLQRCLVRTHKGIHEDVDSDDAFIVCRRADHIAKTGARVFGRGVHLDHHIERFNRVLNHERVRRACRFWRFVRRKVVHVQELEHLVDVEVAIERDVAVAQLIVTRVVVEEVFVGEVRDRARQAARLETIGGIGKERRLERVEEHVVRIGHDALHLVEHHAVIRERRVGALELVVPTLLFEDLFALVDGRMEHRIEIDIHKVHQVFLVRARNGIDCLVCEGHGVQERLHRALEQVHERLLHRELVRAAQHRMLQDVEDARIVHRWCLEANGEGFVVVFVCQIEQARAAFVTHKGCGAVDLGQFFMCFDREAVGFRSRSKIHLPSFVLRRCALLSRLHFSYSIINHRHLASIVLHSISGEGKTQGSPLVATRGLRLRGGWVDPLSLLDSLQYLAGYLVHFAPSNSLLRIKSADSESSNHPTGSAPYGSDNPERLVSYLYQRKG